MSFSFNDRIKKILDSSHLGYYHLSGMHSLTQGETTIYLCSSSELLKLKEVFVEYLEDINVYPIGQTSIVPLSSLITSMEEGSQDDSLLFSLKSLIYKDVVIEFYKQSMPRFEEFDTRLRKFRALSNHAPIKNIKFNKNEVFTGRLLGKPAASIISNDSKYTIPEDVEISFDQSKIDIVYTWVDGADTDWLERKNIRETGQEMLAASTENRFLQRDELKYSLRSIAKHASWVRKVFIVTDKQVPSWLKESEKISIVDHTDIFENQECLPVFNSHAIESNLHNIEGLSEHFIYFNDDVVLGRKTSPFDFFNESGMAYVNFSKGLTYDKGILEQGTLATDHAFLNNIKVIEDRFDVIPIAKVQHTPHPMLRSSLQEIEVLCKDELEITRSQPFRSNYDLNVTSNLVQHYMLASGKAVQPAEHLNTSKSNYLYIDTGRLHSIIKYLRIIFKRPKFLCFNTHIKESISLHWQKKILKVVFTILFPFKSHYEK